MNKRLSRFLFSLSWSSLHEDSSHPPIHPSFSKAHSLLQYPFTVRLFAATICLFALLSNWTLHKFFANQYKPKRKTYIPSVLLIPWESKRWHLSPSLHHLDTSRVRQELTQEAEDGTRGLKTTRTKLDRVKKGGKAICLGSFGKISFFRWRHIDRDLWREHWGCVGEMEKGLGLEEDEQFPLSLPAECAFSLHSLVPPCLSLSQNSSTEQRGITNSLMSKPTWDPTSLHQYTIS